ncbi:UDP-glucuronosyltransferase 2C1-like [Lytechinus pictus]|uniref:UDP-glucuronosyltransferase 2C1-like n=1 Tax=Lytechinus pictus TaxID=7653 RepID=UPI0030B9F6C8
MGKIPSKTHMHQKGGILGNNWRYSACSTWAALMDSTGHHGAVLFTLGTYAGSASTLPLYEMEKLSRAFSAIPQLVIWQMKGKPPPELQVGENTKIMSWVPQNDLLGHPNMKAMVFHGGNNGMYEALYHGVPMVVMPLIFDHPDVATRVVDRGMGIEVNFFSFTSEELAKAINDVIHNSSYKENVLRWSSIFKANPQRPMERAVYWIEHVLKYGGDYLRTSRTDLYMWQVYSIDVYAFLLFVIYLCYRVLKFIYIRQYFRIVWSRFCIIIGYPLRRVCPASLRLQLNMSGNLGRRFWRRHPPRENGKV